jgi:hypothetical protein
MVRGRGVRVVCVLSSSSDGDGTGVGGAGGEAWGVLCALFEGLAGLETLLRAYEESGGALDAAIDRVTDALRAEQEREEEGSGGGGGGEDQDPFVSPGGTDAGCGDMLMWWRVWGVGWQWESFRSLREVLSGSGLDDGVLLEALSATNGDAQAAALLLVNDPPEPVSPPRRGLVGVVRREALACAHPYGLVDPVLGRSTVARPLGGNGYP